MYVTSVHVYNSLHELYCRYIFVLFPLPCFPGFIPALTLYFHECEQHTIYFISHIVIFPVQLPRKQET